jgi:hypothetical protein
MTELDFTAQLRAWSFRRQGFDGSLGDPMTVLERLVGVYSTNPSGALSLLARLADLTPETALALDKDGAAVRFPSMHGSTHLIPTSLAGIVHGATAVAPERFVPQLRGEGLDLAAYQAMKPGLLRKLATPVEARTMKKSLDLSSAEVLAVRTMARELLVLRIAGSVRTDRLHYVATDAWLGRPVEVVEQEDATRLLAERYLRGFGPARVQDLAWWMPASQARVRAALAELDLVEVAPGYLLPADLADAFRAVEPLDPAIVTLIPKWDAWTMGYAPDGRERIADEAHLPLAYSTTETSATKASGDGWPLVLRGGRAVARWDSRYVTNRLEITIMPFPSERIVEAGVHGGFVKIAVFLGCAEVAISWA